MWDYLVWLLLPVAAASGWLAARASNKSGHSVKTVSHSSQQGYFKGLNYILNEQPDKAIEVFVEMVQVDSETVETHLALGNLFRKRGEVDRAIRIHQNLIARPTLNVEQRAHALAELGQDYMSAGLLDRAENIFSELENHTQYRSLALSSLRDIYQSEKEWDNAIKVTRNMANLSRVERNRIIAQYYCELAEVAKEKNDTPLVKRHLKQAIGADPNCARASLLQGDTEYAIGNLKSALRCYQRFVSQAPYLTDEVIERIYSCHQGLGTVKQLCKELSASQGFAKGSKAGKLAFELFTEDQQGRAGIEKAYASFEDEPGMSSLINWLKLVSKDKACIEQNELEKLLAVLFGMEEEKEGYRCQHCGYVAKSLHWLCPSCKHWDSSRPINAVEG